METLTKPRLQAMDRLRQTFAAQARLLDQTMNEMQSLESEIQERVLRAMQETEENCDRQAEGRLKAAVEEAEENTRILVTEELQDRFKQESAAELESAKQEWFSELGLLTDEIDRLKRRAADLEIERTKLVADCEAANQLLDEMREQHNRALAETDEAAAIALERQLSTTVDRVRSDAEARFKIERDELAAQRDDALKSVTEKETEHQKSMLMVDRFRNEITEERDRLRHAVFLNRELLLAQIGDVRTVGVVGN